MLIFSSVHYIDMVFSCIHFLCYVYSLLWSTLCTALLLRQVVGCLSISMGDPKLDLLISILTSIVFILLFCESLCHFYLFGDVFSDSLVSNIYLSWDLSIVCSHTFLNFGYIYSYFYFLWWFLFSVIYYLVLYDFVGAKSLYFIWFCRVIFII